MRTCGRPTKSKSPCRQVVSDDFQFACSLHEDDEDIAKRKLLHGAYEQGIELGEERYKNRTMHERHTLESQVRDLTRQVEHLRDRLAQQLHGPRAKRGDAPQVVTVDGRYAYKWEGTYELQVGDTVRLPDAGFGGPRNGVVTGLGSDYDGYMARITCRVADS